MLSSLYEWVNVSFLSYGDICRQVLSLAATDPDLGKEQWVQRITTSFLIYNIALVLKKVQLVS